MPRLLKLNQTAVFLSQGTSNGGQWTLKVMAERLGACTVPSLMSGHLYKKILIRTTMQLGSCDRLLAAMALRSKDNWM